MRGMAKVETVRRTGPARTLLDYTALRVVAFLGSFGLLLLVGLRGLLAVAAALLVSSLASLFLLRRQRDAVTALFESRSQAKQAERQRLRDLLDSPTDQP